MAGRDGNSQYFEVMPSGRGKHYEVTINYAKHHWCSCRGMISKKTTWGDDAGKTKGTSCKHIEQIINTQLGGDWGTKNKDGSRTPKNKPAASPISTPSKPTGRRALVLATRAKLAKEGTTVNVSLDGSLQDRIAALESAR